MAQHQFYYSPDEYEAEKASNSYLMALVVIMVGLPFPIVNLIASLIFFFSTKKSSAFARWHCTQALLLQTALFFITSAEVYWAILIFIGHSAVSNNFIAYSITVVLFSLVGFIAAMYAAILTRRGQHVIWWFFGPLTDLLIKV
jgi:uncharacterized membrane protein